MEKLVPEFLSYYRQAPESDRLQVGVVQLEFLRTKEVIDRWLFNLWVANNLSAGNDLTFSAGETKNRGSCRSSSCPCFVSCDSS
jgi:hypothetical protein